MGRKIPGKKHRTIKDPYQQRFNRESSIKDKINQPPSKIDHQEIPKSVLHVKKLIEMTKNGEFERKKVRRKKNELISTDMFAEKETLQAGMTKPDKPVKVLKQKPRESLRKFLYRVHKMTDDVIKESMYEKTFGVEIQKNPKTGKIEKIVKRKKDELEKYADEQKKLKKQKNSQEEVKKKKSLWEKRKEKRKKKLDLSLEKKKDFDQLKDEIKFGDVVSCPPRLQTKGFERKPAKNLLLSSLFSNATTKSDSSSVIKNNIELEKQEVQRKLAVEAYRMYKKMNKNKL